MPEAGRVVTGSAGGLRLEAPGPGTRPLSDKVKQALFSMLVSEREVAHEWPTLDLFAGSGAAGIEALSRGSPAAVLVAATVYFGLDTSFTVGSAAQAAAQLMGGLR